MSCSACIENPKKFLATSTHHLILQKNLPTVYDDEFLGKNLSNYYYYYYYYFYYYFNTFVIII